MKRILSFAFGLLAALPAANAQKLDPIQWTLTSDVAKAPAGASVPRICGRSSVLLRDHPRY